MAPRRRRVHDGGPAVVDSDGVHALETRAVDLAGNTTDWRSDTVRVDVTAPVNETPRRRGLALDRRTR